MSNSAAAASVRIALAAIGRLVLLRRAFSHRIRNAPQVVAVTDDTDFKTYDSGPVMDCYVDAELTSGLAVSWWLEITWAAPQFMMAASVSVTHSNGQDAIQQWEYASDTPDEVFGQVTSFWERATDIDVDEALLRYGMRHAADALPE